MNWWEFLFVRWFRAEAGCGNDWTVICCMYDECVPEWNPKFFTRHR